MAKPLPLATSSTVSMFSVYESLGVDPNRFSRAVESVGGSHPHAALHELVLARQDLDTLIDYTVTQIRRRGGRLSTWARIGQMLGTSAQAAHKRFRHLEE